MMQRDTYFASPERDDKQKILELRQDLLNFQNLEEIFDQLPHFLLLLTEHRQVVFCNHELLDYLSVQDVNELLGIRPGELFKCIHSTEMPAGCGTSQPCQYCGAAKALVEAQQTKQRKEHICRIISEKNHQKQYFTFNIVVYPYKIGGRYYYLFFLEDVTEKERNQQLELTFLHDLGNLFGALTGYIETFPKEGLTEEQKDFMGNMQKIQSYISEEIQAQREISYLETEQIHISLSTFTSHELIQNCIDIMNDRFHSAYNRIFFDGSSEEFLITSDQMKIRRILLNFLKNAIDASQSNETVRIGSRLKKNQYSFWVTNQQAIPQEIQAHIFQFGYSTKGKGHGLGLYSAKILTEEVLRGTIGFESNDKQGTIFFVKFPKNT